MPSHVEQRVAYCAGNEEHRALEQKTLDKLIEQKEDKMLQLASFKSAFKDEKVQRGVKTAAAVTLGNMLLPYVWHTLTDSKADAQCRTQIQPGFTLSTLSNMLQAYLAYNAFVAPKIEDLAGKAEELAQQIKTLDKQIAECKDVLKLSASEHDSDMVRSASTSAMS